MAKKVLIKNIDKIVSGDLKKGIVPGDAVLIEDGLISGVGFESQLDTKDVGKIVDANGSVTIPALIDSHVHPWLEDYCPSAGNISRWMEGNLSTGVVTLIAAEVNRLGTVKDPIYVKSLALLAHKKWKAYKPGGYQKVEAGAIIYVDGLTEQDFKELADQGLFLIAEAGCTGIADPQKIKQYVTWSKKYNMIVSVHCGGVSTTDATATSYNMMKEIKPHVFAHLNGGPTAMPMEDCRKAVTELDGALEMSWNGNPMMMYEIMEFIKEKDQLHRVIIGSDSPTGLGYSAFAIHNVIQRISSLNKIPAQDVIAMATGNTADVFRLNRGKIEVGKEADILIIDCPPDSVGDDALKAIEIGDQPAISMVMVNGHIIAVWGRATRAPKRKIRIDGVTQPDHKLSFEEYILGPNAFFREF